MPTDKRARHKAARQARMAELRRAQQRRKRLRQGGVVAVFVVIALVLAYVSSRGGHHTTKVSTKTTTPTTALAPSSTTSVASTAALPLTSVEKYLTARTAPARSAACDDPMTGTSTSTAPTTTVPAKGNAVSTVAAPQGVGFPSLTGTAPRYTSFSSPPPFCIDPAATYTATMTTTAGTMTFTLLPRYAPLTVNNFVFLAGYHYFDGIVFHRVITGFVDQGGDPTGTGEGGPGYKFADELPKSNGAYDAGSLAMANSGANTNGSQFFIVVGSGGAQLSPAYSVFGQVTKGLAVADKINAEGSSSGTPKTLVKILSVSIATTAAS